MTKRRGIVAGACVLVSVLNCVLALRLGFGAGGAASQVAMLPEAPQQKSPWAAPKTQLPEDLVKAVDLLFAQGMADPRGCEYRQIEVVVGSVWGRDGEPMKTHGWVLPTKSKDGKQFAVCWNGLVYPAVSVGQPADLRADIAAMLEKDRKGQEEWAKDEKRSAHFPYRHSWGVTKESAAVSYESMTPLKVCLLLRVGEVALAEAYWGEFSKGEGREGGPYVTLASEWAWCAFDRAVCAHMRGDDVLSVASGRLLMGGETPAEAGKRERGREGVKPLYTGDASSPPYLKFLEPLPKLLADGERRINASEKPMSLEAAAKIADKGTRIKALIQCLEAVNERQDGQPGGVSIGFSPIVMALEKEGTDAVEPLLACLENDRRLTRSVSFGRDFHEGRNLIPVASAAYEALRQILQTDEFGAEGVKDRKVMANQIRAFWQKGKGKSPAERWYEMLADDGAGKKQWLEAVQRIVRPIDEEHRGGWVSEPTRKPAEVPKMHGEELRKKTNPSVAELMAKRVPAIAASETNSSHAAFAASEAADVALALYRWDSKAAAPVLRAQLQECKAMAAQWVGDTDFYGLTRKIARLSSALAACGDADALKEYAAWVRAQTPKGGGMGTDVAEMFSPMWEHPDDPAVVSAMEGLFSDAGSPWRCLPRVSGLSMGRRDELVASPLIAVGGFRKSVLANLADTTRLGVLTVRDGQGRIEMDGGGTMGYGLMEADETLLPKPGEQRIVRVCDWYASHVSGLHGAPAFGQHWPDEKRDAAIKECAAFLRDWGDRYRYNEMQKALGAGASWGRTHMTFAKLDHPATEAEVKAHVAIFSLGDAGQRRVAPLEPFPMRAKWRTLKQFPVRYQTYDPKTKEQKAVVNYDQKGLVWQAEEVMEKGQWKRYYGFVGTHIVAKVQAEEIELLADFAAWDSRGE